MAYFDLHFHPSFKSFMSDDVKELRGTCWDDYIEPSYVSFLTSQSSLTQCKAGNIRLGVATIVNMEHPYSTSVKIRLVTPTTFLDPDMFNRPTGTEDFSYFKEEIDHLRRSINLAPQDAQIIKDMAEFDPAKMNFVLAIEGAHSIADNINNTLQNLIALKKDPNFRFLYLTLVHQTRYPTCNHAFCVKGINDNKQFRPKGSGLTAYGKQVIDAAYDPKIGGYSVLIDVKHMGLSSRKDFYAYRDQHPEYKNIPIVASHMGLTGISWKTDVLSRHVRKAEGVDSGYAVRVTWKKPDGILKDCQFNPWSVNLYDEEIPIILASKGLIGLILDCRVLGAKEVSEEYFDYNNYYKELKLPLTRDDSPWDTDTDESEETNYSEGIKDVMSRTNAKKHLRHLCNQIFHLIKCGGVQAWDHISVGSDFDGMVAPIKACISTAEYPQLERNLKEMMLKHLGEVQAKYPRIDFGLDTSNASDRIRGIMYKNGENFLKKHFTKNEEVIA